MSTDIMAVAAHLTGGKGSSLALLNTIKGVKVPEFFVVTTAGFVCYKRNVLETIRLDKIRFVGYAFQIEMKFKTWKLGFNIKEVSVVFTDRTLGESKMSDGIVYEALFGVLKMRFKGLR